MAVGRYDFRQIGGRQQRAFLQILRGYYTRAEHFGELFAHRCGLKFAHSRLLTHDLETIQQEFDDYAAYAC